MPLDRTLGAGTGDRRGQLLADHCVYSRSQDMAEHRAGVTGRAARSRRREWLQQPGLSQNENVVCFEPEEDRSLFREQPGGHPSEVEQFTAPHLFKIIRLTW